VVEEGESISRSKLWLAVITLELALLINFVYGFVGFSFVGFGFEVVMEILFDVCLPYFVVQVTMADLCLVPQIFNARR